MKSGLDASAIDSSIRPQDDLFAHTNGGWLAATDIPADRGRYGTFDVLREQAERDIREIITSVADGDPQPGTVAAKVGDLFASFMDEEAIEKAGMTPLGPLLERAAGVTSARDLAEVTGGLNREGIDGFVLPFVSTDDRDSSRYLIHLEQGGLGLPDESYYREPQHEATRTAYLAHIERMLTLAEVADPQAAAARVMDLETRLASAHWDNVTTRDPVKSYTLATREDLAQLAPSVDWSAWAKALGAPESALDEVIVRQPDFLTAVSAAFDEVDITAWQDWLRWRIVHALAPYLSAAVVEENFDFYGRTLSGVPEMRDRWKRGVGLVEDALGEAVGQLYVEKHFPPANKAAMERLVENLVEAFRQDFASLEWMEPATREAAKVKLEAFRPKIGYPDTWRDYSGLEISANDLLGNVRRAAAFELDRDLGKLGGPVDRDEWFMTPQTVNAYYNPGMNEIVFPAAILQPPFFDVDADDAVNYGGIGAVIGHEIGHGFDDQGSQYDGEGNLRNWWGEQDRTAFMERAGQLIAQFDTLEPRDAPGQKVNGSLTIGENIGDLCGLVIGLRAYRIAQRDQPAPVIEGRTGEQRFFMGWAQIWRGVAREAEAKRLLQIDPHAPMDLRANTARNLHAFHEAFDTAPGDGMWLEPEERIAVF